MIPKIKFFLLVLIISTSSTLSLQAQKATKWKIDKSHTSVNFTINHFFSAVTGKFNKFDGNINFDQNNLVESKAEFTISVNSVNTDNKKRDNHLKSKDFFNEKKFSTMKFKSSKFEKKSDTEYLIFGKLTIRDITKEVTLPMKITGQMEHPMMKGTIILGVVIDTQISRTEFGVGTGDWAATMVVADEVKIHIPMELNRKK